MASLIVSVQVTWCVHRHVSHPHTFWFTAANPTATVLLGESRSCLRKRCRSFADSLPLADDLKKQEGPGRPFFKDKGFCTGGRAEGPCRHSHSRSVPCFAAGVWKPCSMPEVAIIVVRNLWLAQFAELVE